MVASSGKAAEHAYLRALGAAEVIGRDDVAADAGRVLGRERWAGAVDCVGGTTLAEVLRQIRYGGAVAASGLTAGNEFTSTVYPFIVRAVTLIGIDSVLTPIEERRAVWASVATDFPAAGGRRHGRARGRAWTVSTRRSPTWRQPRCAAASSSARRG